MSKYSLKTYVTISATLIIFLLGIFTTNTALESYKQSILSASQNANNISLLVSKQAENIFQTINLILQEIDNKLQLAEPSDKGSHSKISDLMRMRLKDASFVRAFFVIGSDGYIIHDTDHTTPHVTLKDREYFLYHKPGARSDLYIGKPLKSRSVGTWFISISRRISTPDGSFSGVIVAAMELKYIQIFYSKLEVGTHDLISIWDESGMLLISYPQFDKLTGEINPEFVFSKLKKKSVSENSDFLSPFDQRMKIVAFNQLEGYPLAAVAEIDKANVFSLWLNRALPGLIFFCVLIVLIIMFSWLLLKYLTSLKLYENDLEFKNLQLSTEKVRYSKAQEIGHVGNWEYDIINKTFWGSEEAKRLYGLNPQIDSYSFEDIDSRIVDHDRFHQTLTDLIEHEKPYDIEYEIYLSDEKEKILIHSIAELLKDDSGKPVKIAGVIQDITKRKLAEEERRKSDERFQIAQEMSPDGFTILRPVRDDQDRVIDFTWIYENEAAARMNGTDPQKVVGQRLLELFPGHQGTQFFNAYKQVAEAGKPITFEEEYVGETIKKKTWFRIVVVPMADNIAILNHDITGRKTAEEKLRKNEQLLSKAQALAHVGGWEYDIGTENFWGSDEAQRIYGFDPENQEFTTDEIEKCIPEREMVHQALIDLIEKNIPYDLEFEIRPISGEGKKIVRSIAEVSRSPEGEPLKVTGVVLDVTHQKKTEEAIKSYKDQLSRLNAHLQNVIEQERISIAREIHDDLGQTLSALKMDMGWIGKRLSSEQGKIVEKIGEMKSLIANTVQSVKRLCSDLRPGILDDLGLAPALSWYTDQVNERSDFNLRITIDLMEFDVNKDLAISIYRIVQESLTNVSRHAQAENVWISLAKDSESIVLKVQDDGTGIDMNTINGRQAFGIIGMRERVFAHDGKFEIIRRKERGTAIKAVFPIERIETP